MPASKSSPRSRKKHALPAAYHPPSPPSPSASPYSPPPAPSHAAFNPYTIPPPEARYFKQHVHRYPAPMSVWERAALWYSANLASNLLEPWEKVVIHALFFALLTLLYIALSRILSAAQIAKLSGRMRFYITGRGEGGMSI
ncbi:hypothetical protein JCM1840_007045 [Sporobolomyces johnsonii]